MNTQRASEVEEVSVLPEVSAGDHSCVGGAKAQPSQHWQALLDSAGEGIYGVDLEGNCTFINRMAISVFGFASHEIVGRNVHDMVHHHYPDGRSFPGHECPVYDVYRTRKPFRGKADTMFRKDGSTFTAEMSAHPVDVDGLVVGAVVTFRDVTAQRQQQEELRQAYMLAEQRTAELNAVIESMPHGVYIATHDGEVRSNERARAQSGESFPRELQTLHKALSGESATQTVHTPANENTAERWIRSVAAPIRMGDKVLGGVAVNTDVTLLRQQDDALRRSEKLAAVGQLASSIAHEINNPLESITNLLYLICHSEVMEEIQEYAETAQAELTRVTEITLQTLRFHRHLSQPAPVDLAELLRTVMALYTGRLLVRSVEAVWRIGAVPKVVCLEGEIRQVINNLIRNSLDAMPQGGRLFIRLLAARNVSDGREGVRVTIGDTGEGITPAIRVRLFEPFQTSKEQTGTGLGLWVSKGIIDKHQGEVLVRTCRGRKHGTAFSIWLPLLASEQLTAPVAPETRLAAE